MIEFTEQDRKLLQENNMMLKAIIKHLANKSNASEDIKNFVINGLANVIVGR